MTTEKAHIIAREIEKFIENCSFDKDPELANAFHLLAQRSVHPLMESLAKVEDAREIHARRMGNFDAASDHQYFATCWRVGQIPPRLSGTMVKILFIEVDRNLHIYGDFQDWPFLCQLIATLQDYVDANVTVVSGDAESELVELERRVANLEKTLIPHGTILNASDGSDLTPGEYEILALSIHDTRPAHAIGDRFFVGETERAHGTPPYWRSGSAGAFSLVTVVRKLR